jgi:hypothetical protein
MSKIYSTLSLGLRFIEADCDEQEVAQAVINRLKEHLVTPKEVLDGEMVFLSTKTMEEEYAID